MAIAYEIACGLNKGKKLTKNVTKPRQSRRKGVSMPTYFASYFYFKCRSISMDLLN